VLKIETGVRCYHAFLTFLAPVQEDVRKDDILGTLELSELASYFGKKRNFSEVCSIESMTLAVSC